MPAVAIFAYDLVFVVFYFLSLIRLVVSRPLGLEVQFPDGRRILKKLPTKEGQELSDDGIDITDQAADHLPEGWDSN